MSDVTNKVLAVSKPYLGPAAEQFLVRQCKLFLKIDSAALTAANLKELAGCFEVGGRAIMDPAKATELAKKIAAL
ncbi:MAG: hypothetical protein ABSC65_20555 [Acidobacteriaceae bacterium]|jgi:hypothetical protein